MSAASDNSSDLIVETVSDIRKSRGFHTINVRRLDSDAILRGEKTAVVVEACSSPQKGDWIVFDTHDGPLNGRCMHDLDDLVFEVTHVSDIPLCTPHQSLVCFVKKEGYTFYMGDCAGQYLEDTITYKKIKKGTHK